MAWNRGDSSQKPVAAKKPAAWHGVIALVAILIIGGLTVYFLSGDSKEVARREGKKGGLIQEVTPAAAPTNKVGEAEKPREIPYWERDTTNGLTKAQRQKWWAYHRPPAKYTNSTSRTESRPAYAIFSARSENALASLMCIEPGATIVGDPGYERWFTKDFLKSLEVPIVVTKDDTEEQAKLKREMTQMKIELKARYDAGEDIAQIMKDTRRELQQLASYKRDIESAFREMVSKGDVTEADVDLFLESANKMLDAKGIAPMKLNPLAKRRLMRLKK